MEMSVEEKIKLICSRENISMTVLADRLGCSLQNISQKLKKGNLREDDMKKIADAIGYDLNISFEKK